MNVIIFTDMNGVYGFGRNLGAYTIASTLRQNNFSVQVIDFFASLTLDDTKQIIDKFVDDETLAIAFSTSYFKVNKPITNILESRKRWFDCDSIPQGREWLFEFTEMFLNKNPNIKFIIGGTQTSRTSTKLRNIDHWVIGESDKVILDLIQGIKENKEIPSVLNNLLNPYENFKNLKMVWHESDLLLEDECVPIELERGCPFNCTFCNFNKIRKPTLRDVDIVRDELIYNYNEFGIRKYMISDLTFVSNVRKTETFCKMFLSLPFKIEWLGMGNIAIFNKMPELRELCLESGCSSMFFGVESMNDKTLTSIRKGISEDVIKKVLYSLREKWKGKIHIFTSFIVGLPFETREKTLETIKWLESSECPVDSYMINRYYIQTEHPKFMTTKTYSHIEKNMEKYGYRVVDGKWINDITKMTEDEATKISRDQYKGTGCKIYSYYMMRMKNLGYSYQDIWYTPMDYKESFVDSEKRKENIRKTYMRRLLE
jgi:radical SAM superfamily enzyme YgiQ (UPF0313 family)